MSNYTDLKSLLGIHQNKNPEISLNSLWATHSRWQVEQVFFLLNALREVYYK